MMDCYYFGVSDRSRGHEFYAGNRPLYRESELPDDFPVRPHSLDAALLPPNLPQEEGRAELIHFRDWTILAFWDRSGDKRGNSNSAFIIRGSISFYEAVEIAKESYPQIWERFDFEVKERQRPLHSALQKDIVAVIRGWPALEEFMRAGDIDGHPQQLIDEIVDACIARVKGYVK